MAESGVSAARGTDQTWKIGHSFAVCVVMAAVGMVGLLTPASSGIYSWLGIMGLLTVLTFVAGHGVTGRLLGCLIDGRNRMSLARLQTILWTLVILSAFLAGALIRISAGVSDSLVIGIPEQLWIVMGISITSLVGSPLIISSKKDKKPREEEKNKTIATLAEQGERTSHDGITNVGQVIVKADPAQASISDLFKGDETANAAQLDLGKIQMLYFTLVLVLAYGAQIGNLFLVDGTFGSLPALSSGMVALLGISHAGFLANKAAPS